MMKFFRKHMNEMLVVFMAALLVIWLGGDALQYFLQYERGLDNQERAVIFGERITLAEMNPSFQDINILTRLGLNWQMVWIGPLVSVVGSDMMTLQQYAGQLGLDRLDEYDWYMLDMEARRSGRVVSRQALDRFKAETRIGGQQLTAVRDQFSVSLERIDQAIQSYVRILDMVDTASRGVKPSEADIREFVRQSQEKVRINAVVLSGAKFLDTSYEPTEQELIEQFESGKDKDPSPWTIAEFGYRQTEKVATEYIRVSAEALLRQQETPRDDDLYEYWQARRDEFLKPVGPPATSTEGTPPEQEKPKPYETFSEAKSKVIERLQEERAKAEALRIGRDLIAQLGRPWAAVPASQPDGYKAPPETETQPDVYTNLLAAYDRRYAAVLSHGEIELTDVRGLASNQDFSQAMAFQGTQRPVPFGQAAFYVAGLEAQRDANADHARLFRSLYETCAEPFVNDSGDVFVFRTTAIQPKQAPASWEALREQLVTDVRSRRAYEEAGRQAQSLAEQAGEGGLRAVLDANSELLAKLGQEAFKQPAPFSRIRSIAYGGQMRVIPSYIAGVGGGGELLEMCFDLAKHVTTQPAQRVKVHEIPSRREHLVIEWVETLPVTQTEYDQERGNAFNHVLTQRRVAFLGNWFDPQEIRRRVGWEDVEPSGKPAPEEDGKGAPPEA